MQTLLVFSLITLLSFTRAQDAIPSLTLVDAVASTNLTVPRNQSLTHQINLPSNTATLLLHWTTFNTTAFPSTLFFLSNTTDSPIRTAGKSTQHNPQAQEYSCTQTEPCATVSSIDFRAFFTRSTRSFLRFVVSPSSPSVIYVTVYNYDTNTTLSSPNPLNGVLSARLTPDPEVDCPGPVFPDDPVCSSHGECVEGACQCDDDSFGGTACETQIIQLPKVNEPPDEQFLINPFPQSYTARINLFSGVVFAIPAPERQEESTVVSVQILRGFVMGRDEDASQKAPKLRLVVTPLTHDPLANVLKENVTLPTPTLEREFRIPPNCVEICLLRFRPTARFLAIFATPSNENMTDGHGLIAISSATRSREQCTLRLGNPTLELALVPAFLVTIAVAAVAVLIMLWLDRRHGFTRTVDRLSGDEIERMYPKTRYSGDIVECSICLCELETGDIVRNLHCNHTYHSACLDPWLTESRASCPTCRTEVRVEQLSDKRHMRRIIQFFLAPIVAVRRSLDRRRGPALVEDPPSDIETGDAGRSLAPQPQPGNENNNGNNEVGNVETTTSNP